MPIRRKPNPRRTLSTVLLSILIPALSVTLAMATAANADAADRRPSHHHRTVKIMTFNIHHGAGTDEVLSLQRIADVILNSGADVIGLQEVDNHYSERSNWADETAELSKLTGFHAVFGANIDDDPPAGSRHRIQYGTAILSRYPITSWDNTHLYRSSEEQEQRGLLRATVNVHGQKLSFYNTHLAADSAVDRQQQVTQILDLMDTRGPAILVGDLNAETDAPEIQTLTDQLTDSWAVSGHGGDGLSFPSDTPTKRIDFILTDRSARPLDTRVVDDQPEASDHRPVISRVWI